MTITTNGFGKTGVTAAFKRCTSHHTHCVPPASMPSVSKAHSLRTHRARTQRTQCTRHTRRQRCVRRQPWPGLTWRRPPPRASHAWPSRQHAASLTRSERALRCAVRGDIGDCGVSHACETLHRDRRLLREDQVALLAQLGDGRAPLPPRWPGVTCRDAAERSRCTRWRVCVRMLSSTTERTR